MSFSATWSPPAQRIAKKTAIPPTRIQVPPRNAALTTLVEQAVDLIKNHGAVPESLLVVTHADSTAREFTMRIRARLNSLGIKFNPGWMYAGTFHSLCLRLLDEHLELTRMKRNYTVLDPFDQHYFLYQRLNDYRSITNSKLVMGEESSPWDQAQNLLKRLNTLTQQALTPRDLVAVDRPEGSALLACYERYLQQQEKANAFDQSTIELEALRLLERNPEVLAGLRNQLAYLMIDEDQDASTIQEQIVHCLADKTWRQSLTPDKEEVLPGFRGTARQTADAARESLLPLNGGGAERARPHQIETIPWWLM